MIEKDYYRLPELEKLFGFTAYDYIYLCEKYNNTIRFYVHNHWFVLIENNFENNNVVGVVNYKGVINILPQHRTDLLQQSQIHASRCILTNKDSITTFESPSDILIKNCFDESHLIVHKNLSDIQETNFLGVVIGEQNRNMLHQENTLLEQSLTFRLKDMVITSNDITWAKIILNIETENQKENLFHIYTKHLIKAYPNKGGAALWNLILKKFHDDDDEIDPYCILNEVYPDKISWKKPDKTDGSITKGTFKNLVSDLKNKKNK
jgi:hypothetical protein